MDSLMQKKLLITEIVSFYDRVSDRSRLPDEEALDTMSLNDLKTLKQELRDTIRSMGGSRDT
jgi:hypothetical protein